jgi:hypothetical protein
VYKPAQFTAILVEYSEFAFTEHFYLSPMNGFLKKLAKKNVTSIKIEKSTFSDSNVRGRGGGGAARFYLCKARHNVSAERDRRRAQINGLTGSEQSRPTSCATHEDGIIGWLLAVCLATATGLLLGNCTPLVTAILTAASSCAPQLH